MASDKTIILTFVVKEDLHAALKKAADDQYTNVSTVVRQVLAEYLREANYLQPRQGAVSGVEARL